MTGVVVVDVGEEAFLDLILAVGYTLRLYRTDVTAGLTPTQIDALTAGSFTEANFAGYTAATLTGGSWTTTQASPSTGVYATQTFTRSSTGAAQLIYGYYVTLTAGGALRWFERFPAPISVEFISDAVEVTPRITLDDRSGNVSVPIGGSILWSGPTAGIPAGWLLRDGSAVSRTTYADLFAVTGTTYGTGDGSTTFNLPDQRGRFPIGVAASGTGSTRGATGGSIDHVHSLDTASSHAQIVTATNNILNTRRTGVTSYNRTHSLPATATLAADTSPSTTGTALGGNSDTANPPFLADYFIIRAT